jgi:glycosyltransferase involved in cell wall biosynthesis
LAGKPSKQARILQVSARFLPFMGGVENHVLQVSRRLAQAGAEVTVLTTDPQGELPEREEIDGIHVERVRAWPANKDYYWAPEIFQRIQAKSWDLIHVQCYHTLVPPMAMLGALRAQTPYVLTFHGGGHSSSFRNSVRRAQRWTLGPLIRRAEKLVAIAKFEIDQYGQELNIPKDRFCLIPNGADLPSIADNSAVKAGQGTLIASIGRLEKYKGHQRVIRAMPAVLQAIPDARLWVAGFGPYEEELKRLAQQFGVAERVDIRGIPPGNRSEMAEMLSQTRVVILMSEFETHPIAALEAIALHKPVVVADTSGLHELAADGLARAIPLESSPAEVAAALVQQIRTPSIPVNFHLPTWDECAMQLFDLYRSILKGEA